MAEYNLTANRLKEAMNDVGTTISELSRLTGVSKASISRYASGNSCPTNLSAGKLCEVLKVSPAWLMGFTDKKEMIVTKYDMKESTKVNTLLKYFYGMSESDQQIVINLSKSLFDHNQIS